MWLEPFLSLGRDCDIVTFCCTCHCIEHEAPGLCHGDSGTSWVTARSRKLCLFLGCSDGLCTSASYKDGTVVPSGGFCEVPGMQWTAYSCLLLRVFRNGVCACPSSTLSGLLGLEWSRGF
jgi:hypothetical protein